METASRLACNRLRQKARVKTVARGDCLYHSLERAEIIRSLQRCAVFKIDFMLARSCLVMRRFRLYAHLVKRKTDIAAYVFTFVARGKIAVSRIVVRNRRRFAFFISLEQIELALGSDLYVIAHFARLYDNVLENIARVAFERAAVKVSDVAEEAHDASVLRTPWKNRQR